MLRRTTWVFLIVFGVLVLFAWVFQRYQTKTSANAATTTPIANSEKLYNSLDSELMDMNITSSNGDSIEFMRESGSTSWVIKGLPDDTADSFQIEAISQQLLSLQVLETLTQSPTLDSIGLANPAYMITILTSNGKQIVTDVGSRTAVGTGYYLRVDSGPIVIVDNASMDNVLNLLKSPPILATSTVEVTGTPIAP
jgi:hypothetical protein